METVISKRYSSLWKWTLIAIRILIGALFVFSGVLKMMDLIEFHDVIMSYNILNESSANLASILIPSLEVVCGLGLISGFFIKGASSIISLLLTTFIIAISISLFRGDQISCGCFGALEAFSKMSYKNIVLDVLLLIPLLLVFVKEMDIKIILNDIKVLLIISSVAMILINIPFGNSKFFAEQDIKKLKYVTISQLIDMIEQEEIVIFDVRDLEKYNEEHITSALPLPVLKFDEFYIKYQGMDKDTKIIVYCDGSFCNASEMVAVKLIRKFYKNLYVFKNGWEQWTEFNAKKQ